MKTTQTSLNSINFKTGEQIPSSVIESTQPVLLKGLAKDWPIVTAGLSSARSAADYLMTFDQALPLTVYHGPPEINGRIFYNDDFSGFNFSRASHTLAEVMAQILAHLNNEAAPTFYVGSTLIDRWLPGFKKENNINLGDREHLSSVWLGNKSRIAAHYDFPNNIACSVVGRRKFTLFPPDQAENLYVGPIDFTPSGQAISLVDGAHPDFDQYPRYREALKASICVELEAGDGIFIPSMWWHQVESLEAFNVLVNYWWRTTPTYLGSPQNALQHAVMSFHDLPPEQLAAWRDIFDRYVFKPDEQDWQHIPSHARGALSDIDQKRALSIRSQLRHFLK